MGALLPQQKQGLRNQTLQPKNLQKSGKFLPTNLFNKLTTNIPLHTVNCTVADYVNVVHLLPSNLSNSIHCGIVHT